MKPSLSGGSSIPPPHAMLNRHNIGMGQNVTPPHHVSPDPAAANFVQPTFNPAGIYLSPNLKIPVTYGRPEILRFERK